MATTNTTNTSLARRFKVDVSPDGSTWTPLLGINDFNPQVTPTTQDANDYDTDGWGRKEITLLEWSLDVKANRKMTASAFDPGQELCRGAQGNFGSAARLQVRWYDRNGGTEAYSGTALVEYNQSKTGVTDIEEVEIKFTGDGPRTLIPNPAKAGA
jgi:hypothetical protein